jgi:hypothetical protein
MVSTYRHNQYSKVHLEEVAEICDLRKYYDIPCRGCSHEGLADCPEVRGVISNDEAKDTVKKSFLSKRKRSK